MANLSLSQSLHARALTSMPLGVNSNVRYWGEGRTLYFNRAKGAYIWDVDGNEYVDFRLAFGPIILGYAYEKVDAAVLRQLQLGVCTGITHEVEIKVAEKIVEFCPSVDLVRIVNSGTEASLHVLRVARAYTGRDKVVKFEGGYHGNNDYLLFSTYANPSVYGNRMNPIPVPASSGIPKELGNLLITLPFNEIDLFKKVAADHGHDIAAVVTEPMLNNYGSAEPDAEFFTGLAAVCRQYGILLILDEVKTGFRVARGGAQEIFQIDADLTFYAKSLGNGYPIAAYGGKQEIMKLIGKGVSQGGTYCGNGIGAAAALATMNEMEDQPVFEVISRLGTRFQEGLESIFREAGLPFVISGHPAIFSFAFDIASNRDAREWAKSNFYIYEELAKGLLHRGILIDPDPREPICLCYSHTESDIDRALEATEKVFRTL